MTKIIINKCFGGFGLSEKAYDWLIKNKGWKVSKYLKDGNTLKDKSAKLILTDEPEFYGKYWAAMDNDELRINAEVIECVKELGALANGNHALLSIVDIPDDIEWEIDEYGGIESIHETHRSWG